MEKKEIKIYNHKQLEEEIEQITNKYNNLLNQLLHSNQEEELKSEFLSYREQVEQRLLDLEEFYQINKKDSRIKPFFIALNKLKSLLQTNIKLNNNKPVIKKTYNYSQIKPLVKTNNLENEIAKSNQTQSKLSKSNKSLRQSSVRSSSSRFSMK